MSKKYSLIFIIVEIGMFALVIFSFLGRSFFKEPDLSANASYFSDEKYALTQTYEEYLGEVRAHLDTYQKKEPQEKILEEEKVEKLPLSYKASSLEEGGGIISKVSTMIKQVEHLVERYTNSQKIAGKQSFVALKKKMDHLLGLDMTSSLTGGQNSQTDNRDVIALTREGHLGWVQDSQPIAEEVENLVDFGLRMKEAGRNFVVIEPPVKYAETEAFRDYSPEKYEYLRSMMDTYGLDQIFVGEELQERGMREEDIFFNTDFHWKPSTGILADGILCDYLNGKCGYQMDGSLFQLDQYRVEKDPDGFLGFMGKKVTMEYCQPDEFEIWYPKYDTDYTVWNSFDESEKTGSLSETLFWYEQLDVPSLYSGNKYEFYGYSDQSLIRVHNNKVKDGSHILVLKTSYGNCMTPYLAAGVEDLDIVDLRAFPNSITSYIEDIDPDTVVMVYGLSSYENFTGENSLFDFR